MGYFSSGSNGEDYIERYCKRCANWQHRHCARYKSCPILDMHDAWNYEQFDDVAKRASLSRFIKPWVCETDGPMPVEQNHMCLMFLADPTPIP